MIILVPLSFMLGAVLYAALAVWRMSIGAFRGTPLLLGMSLAGMAIWNVAVLLGGPVGGSLAEVLRNSLWITYLAAIVRNDRASAAQRWLATLPYVLIAVALARAALVALVSLVGVEPEWWGPAISIGCSLGFCIGALVFVQSLYLAAHRAASGFRLILFALALLWAYDLNLYAIVPLGFRVPLALAQSRGFVSLALVPLLAIAARRKQYWSIALSHRLAFQSLSVVAIGAYFVFVATIASARPWLSGEFFAIGQIAALAAVSLAILTLLLSPRVRSTVKVLISKHLFEHRYDYRSEWLRFNATMNSGGPGGLSPEQRAVKALADLMEAAGGLLFLGEERGHLVCATSFERSGAAPSAGEIDLTDHLLERIEANSQIMISPQHGGSNDAGDFPSALAASEDLWLLVPLVRASALVGIVALGRPTVPRPLDWEDFDLLKVLGQQIAAYLADAHSQAELEEARQFEEFNRRFAFIVHDVKNVVSQLSLVAANAEEHGANPRFQADMVSTLGNSVGKMKTLLARLSVESHAPTLALSRVDAASLLETIAAARRAQHPVAVELDTDVAILADQVKLNAAIDHLVQNAIEASAPDSAVTLSLRRNAGRGLLSVRDQGQGMSPDFMRRQLFKPFASTKSAGFGLGASEARALIRQMGGELHVQSAEGAGTTFTITLPAAAD